MSKLDTPSATPSEAKWECDHDGIRTELEHTPHGICLSVDWIEQGISVNGSHHFIPLDKAAGMAAWLSRYAPSETATPKGNAAGVWLPLSFDENRVLVDANRQPVTIKELHDAFLQLKKTFNDHPAPRSAIAPSKVWLVLKHYDYEGDDVVAVVATEDEAKRVVERLEAQISSGESGADRATLKQWEIGEETLT